MPEHEDITGVGNLHESKCALYDASGNTIISSDGSELFIAEQAAAAADVAGFGQIWVNSGDAPHTLWFTEDGGTDYEVALKNSSGVLQLDTGVRQTFVPDATNAGINVGSFAGDPSTPSNGDLWYDSTANELTARINGANVALGAGGGGGADTALSNLSAVAINTSLISDTDATDDLGSSSIAWKRLYLEAGTATDIPVNIELASAQSANALNITSNGGTAGDLLLVDSDGYLQIAGDGTPLAKIHVGDRGTNNSVDAQILVARDTTGDGISGNGHAFADSTLFNRSGTVAYNSFDARCNIQSQNYDHYAAFQSLPNIAIGVNTMTNLYGLYASSTVTSGTITNYYGMKVVDFAGGGVVTTQYGLHIDALANASTNYGVYTAGSLMSQFGRITLLSNAASDIPLTITAHASQSGNLINATSNGGSAGDLFHVTSAGFVNVVNNTVTIRDWGGTTTYGAIYFQQASPSTANMALFGRNNETYLCGGGTSGVVNFRINTTNYASLSATTFLFSAVSASRVPVRIKLAGSQTGNAFEIDSSAGSSGDVFHINANGTFNGAYTTTAADPTTTEYPTDKDWGIHENSSSGNVYLAFNNGGSIVKVQLT